MVKMMGQLACRDVARYHNVEEPALARVPQALSVGRTVCPSLTVDSCPQLYGVNAEFATHEKSCSDNTSGLPSLELEALPVESLSSDSWRIKNKNGAHNGACCCLDR